MSKSAVDNASITGFVIDILNGTWNWLTKNLFIDRDINDIKDPKNDKPNNIFKIFQPRKNFDIARMWFSENSDPRYSGALNQGMWKIFSQKKIITR